VFAPTDAAFSALSENELNKLLTDKDAANELVSKHITASTLFTAGMRFYQIRDSLTPGKPITVQKNTAGMSFSLKA